VRHREDTSVDAVAVIVTCKGRLEHLRRTAPLLLGASPPVPIGYHLVDWGCPEQSGEWLKETFPQARVIRTEAKGFEKTRAANLGAKCAIEAGYKYLLFADADTILHPPALGWLSLNRDPGRQLITPGRDPQGQTFKQLVGLLLVPSSAFAAVGGYDTSFGATYGHEDIDLRLRLFFLAGLEPSLMPVSLIQSRMVDAIPHPDELRLRYYQNKDIRAQFSTTLDHLDARFRKYVGRTLGYEQHQGPRQRTVNQLLGLN